MVSVGFMVSQLWAKSWGRFPECNLSLTFHIKDRSARKTSLNRYMGTL